MLGLLSRISHQTRATNEWDAKPDHPGKIVHLAIRTGGTIQTRSFSIQHRLKQQHFVASG
jgi:hypothetical protein